MLEARDADEGSIHGSLPLPEAEVVTDEALSESSVTMAAQAPEVPHQNGSPSEEPTILVGSPSAAVPSTEVENPSGSTNRVTATPQQGSSGRQQPIAEYLVPVGTVQTMVRGPLAGLNSTPQQGELNMTHEFQRFINDEITQVPVITAQERDRLSMTEQPASIMKSLEITTVPQPAACGAGIDDEPVAVRTRGKMNLEGGLTHT